MPCAADSSGFPAKPAGRPRLACPTGTQGSLANEPDSPVTRLLRGFSKRSVLFLAYEPFSPGGTRPPGSLTEQNLRKQKLRQYQLFNSPALAMGDRNHSEYAVGIPAASGLPLTK